MSNESIFYLDAFQYLTEYKKEENLTLSNLHTNTAHSQSGCDHYCAEHSNYYNDCSDCNDCSNQYECYEKYVDDSTSEYNKYNYDQHNDYYSPTCEEIGPHSQTNCYEHSQSGCNHCTDCTDSCSERYDAYSESGCSENSCSNNGACNHTYKCSDIAAVNYTNNYSPRISGTVTANETFSNSLSLNWPAATDSDSSDVVTYNIFYKYKPVSDTDYGVWNSLITGVTTNTYNVDTSDTSKWLAGNYIFAITADDGKESSAILNSDSTDFISDTRSQTDLVTMVVYTGEISCVRYTAPSWKNPIYDEDTVLRKYDVDEVRNEINTASEAFGLSQVSFDESIIANQTYMKTSHIIELRTKGNDILTSLNKTTKTWTRNSLEAGMQIKGLDLKEIRVLLEDLS